MIQPRLPVRPLPAARHRRPNAERGPARETFFGLLGGDADPARLGVAEEFLRGQIAEAAGLESDLPADASGLESWVAAGVERVGARYRDYLAGRRAGEPRRYFGSRSHALYFLRSVAPTKVVDGAWLYAMLPRWRDPRFLPLVRTYLEELGDGQPDKNHVVLYRKLLAAEGCERWDDLSDGHYVQGAIQLALAAHGERYLPEVVGYNLGYEQLPLHLLVTAYELRELKIDPYYFVLHVTVDNADSGHARQAAQAVLDLMPKCGDPREFWRRVGDGYRLNGLGVGTEEAIASFDPGDEVAAIFRRKAAIGRHLHSDRARIEGRTVNEWLADEDSAAEFAAALERTGWIRRHRSPEESPFWKLMQGETAKMFGVFDPYEQQVIRDWIAGDRLGEEPRGGRGHVRRFDDGAFGPSTAADVRRRDSKAAAWHGDGDADLEELERRLGATDDLCDRARTLIEFMSPALHHTPAGLAATRAFCELLR